LLDESEWQNRLEEIEQYAQDNIEESILDAAMDPCARSFLLTYVHKFVVEVVFRKGPGGISWCPVMNTIDVLLWTVSSDRQDGDLQRFVKVQPRLLQNLGKALEVDAIEKPEAEQAMPSMFRQYLGTRLVFGLNFNGRQSNPFAVRWR